MEQIKEENGIKYIVHTNDVGTKFWYKEGTGILHREDGPALEYTNGDKYWYKRGQYHREDGPAIEYASGKKYWYKNGLVHREDGHAIEYLNGSKEYWINGEYLKDIKTDEELMIKLLLE